MSNNLTESHFRALRQEMSRDKHRPLFHFIAPANWMNDPHGLIEWQGELHLFYQYNPLGPRDHPLGTRRD